ncbi:hypothetical protein [Streptomyces puniciscabiei]|uniref:hypothetical protein n=1 Tax=Streptomyces puniciscabiei TaxID=164348 RepID=UPI0006EBA2B3|nr:hypothetical protein [Streptomyces puniciscabiei]
MPSPSTPGTPWAVISGTPGPSGRLSARACRGAFEPHTLDNIRDLWQKLWPYISEDARFGAGTRLARFLADADQAQAVLARQLIDLAQGGSYLLVAVNVSELAEALDELMDVHLVLNNFYNEPRVARRLAELVGQYGSSRKTSSGST